MVFYNSYLFGAILSLGTIQLPATGWQNIVTTTSYNSSSNKTHKPATSWKNVITVTATAYNS
ncbi:MAG: hypothetical protein IMF12_06590, partial [Proteobacteria bacterium]|nr:hypothetical protein [Pseudomonadota bacterium]